MLINLFGNYPEIRVLDYVTDYLFEGHTQEKLAKECMILEKHLKKFLDKLEIWRFTMRSMENTLLILILH